MSQAPVINISFKDVDLPPPSVPAPPPQTLEYSRPRRASMTPGTPTLTWYADKFRSPAFPLDNYCVECSTFFAAANTFKRHMKHIHKQEVAQEKPGPTQLLSRKRRLEQQRQSARKRASADRMKKTAETRDKSANKYFMKISALVGDEKLERYLKLLENCDIAMEKIQYVRSILNVETEYGEC
ncbi:hypothetical protein INT45_009744 [Circinella minor]|uniref:C2H2-type domain-containing protein n=1 Tax=Circinella minor TaxID=1195481 RepID=A0A8H7V626_9FUNG|nr:hypothetical protein INT45_009744 [Circinella minor]